MSPPNGENGVVYEASMRGVLGDARRAQTTPYGQSIGPPPPVRLMQREVLKVSV